MKQLMTSTIYIICYHNGTVCEPLTKETRYHSVANLQKLTEQSSDSRKQNHDHPVERSSLYCGLYTTMSAGRCLALIGVIKGQDNEYHLVRSNDYPIRINIPGRKRMRRRGRMGEDVLRIEYMHFVTKCRPIVQTVLGRSRC